MSESNKRIERLEKRNKLLYTSFGRYLSDELVDHLLSSPQNMEPGGRKQYLTILMNDLRGFTTLSERMDVQDFMTMLNHYLSEMTEVINARGGIVLEYTGDGILAVFGANSEQTTHPADAIAAAICMQNRMAEVNRWNHIRDYPDLEMGVGINTGEVIIGNLGSERHMKYGVVGRTVNMASRLEGYSYGGQILISQSTREACQAELTVIKEVQVMPKGSAEYMTVSDVCGIGAPYDLKCCAYEEPLVKLIHGYPVRFQWINGKHASASIAHAEIAEISYTGALIQTEQELAGFDNLQIDLDTGEYLYGMVVQETQSGWIMRFTSRPVGFKYWLSDLLKANRKEMEDGEL